MKASVESEKNIAGRESQGACRHDELLGGKQSVVKREEEKKGGDAERERMSSGKKRRSRNGRKQKDMEEM
jgi:hypothetical protein